MSIWFVYAHLHFFIFGGIIIVITQMLLKNITSNAKKMMEIPNANATMENMGQLFKKNMAKHDVKSVMSGVMVSWWWWGLLFAVLQIVPSSFFKSSFSFTYLKCLSSSETKI